MKLLWVDKSSSLNPFQKENKLTMGHEADATTDHAPHAYTWTLSADTLILIHDNTKSVFLKKE